MTLQLLRMRDVAARVSYSESKLYTMIRSGDCPRGRKMPMGGVRWLSEEMDTWIRKTYAKSEEAGAKEGSGQVKEGRAPTRLSVLRGLSVCDVLRANTIAAKSEPPSQ